MNITAIRNNVDMMPKIDAYDKTERGIRTVGIRLTNGEFRKHQRDGIYIHDESENLVSVGRVGGQDCM